MARRSITTEAVVLRRVPYGDSDLIATLLTRDRGKLSAIARGARRSRRRFGAGLGLFCISYASLTENPRGDLWTLSGTDLVQSFAGLAADVAPMAHASYGTELARELTAAEQPEPVVFELLVELYGALASRGASPPALRAFEIRLLTAVGLGPVLEACARCGASLPMGAGDGARMVPSRGGVACGACADEGGRPLDPPARALLVAAGQLPLSGAADDLAGVDAEAARQARDAMVQLVLSHVGKPLRSLEFIAKLRAGAPRPATTDRET